VDGDKRIEGIDAPTLKELGLSDQAISTMAGVLAPAGLSAEQQRDIVTMVDKMRQTSCWQQVLKQNNWVDAWTPGDSFKQVLTEQRGQITTILGELGLGK
jgi:putative tricarboxylic transport membrane protein